MVRDGVQQAQGDELQPKQLPRPPVEAEHDRCYKDLGNQFSRVPFTVRNKLVDRFHSQFQIGTGNASLIAIPNLAHKPVCIAL